MQKSNVPSKRGRSKADETEDETISEKGADDDVAVGYVADEIALEETISDTKAVESHPSESRQNVARSTSMAVVPSDDSDEDSEDSEAKDIVALRALEGCSLFGTGAAKASNSAQASKPVR